MRDRVLQEAPHETRVQSASQAMLHISMPGPGTGRVWVPFGLNVRSPEQGVWVGQKDEH